MFVLALLIALGGAEPSTDQNCATIEMTRDDPGDERLMPENETFFANLTYVVPASPNPSALCGASDCSDLERRTYWSVEHAPTYARVFFEPNESRPAINASHTGYSSSTRLSITTDGDAPAFEDGQYALRAFTCGGPQGTLTFTIKNDYAPNTGVDVQGPYVEDGPAPGIPGLTGPTLGALVVVVAMLRRSARSP